MKSHFLLIILACLFSCGKNLEDKTGETNSQQEESIDGTFSAFLSPVGPAIFSSVTGEVKIFKYGDSFRVQVSVKNSPGGTHKQFLHTGRSCGDVGAKLLPLDDDLSGQFRGYRYFPSGSYQYRRSTSYYLMLSDLHLPDNDPTDDIVKLDGWELPLNNRPVVIYARYEGRERMLACGLLSKINSNEDDISTWEDEPSRRPTPGRVSSGSTPRPRPVPQPSPPTETSPSDTDSSEPTSWWERLRERWRRWRDRIRGASLDNVSTAQIRVINISNLKN